MIIAFTGGRDYANRELVERVVAGMWPVSVHVGDARGLDQLVRECLTTYGLCGTTVFYADWNKHGRAAGPIRNREMLEGVTLLVAFPGGRGTADCMRQARSLHIPILHVEET